MASAGRRAPRSTRPSPTGAPAAALSRPSPIWRPWWTERHRGSDEVLGALLVLAREGDELAARTALQAVLGSVVRLARRTVAHAGGDLEESISRAVEACWRIIRNYPVERACRPLDGISLDVLAVLTGSGRHGEAEVPVGLPVDLGDPIQADEDTSELRAAFWAAVRSGMPGPVRTRNSSCCSPGRSGPVSSAGRRPTCCYGSTRPTNLVVPSPAVRWPNISGSRTPPYVSGLPGNAAPCGCRAGVTSAAEPAAA